MKQLNAFRQIALFIMALLSINACKHPPGKVPVPTVDPAATQYPLEVAKIMVGKCATAGCHNAASYTAAANLRLDDWKYLFDGSVNGAVAIPYCAENSSILYFLNPSAGEYDALSVAPTMPYNQSPLSKDEYNIIKNWIAKGAPDKNGNIPFASNAETRQKVYMAQQGCDWVAVVDADKKVVMRYIKVGGNANIIESPHTVQVDNNGRYAYVCFLAGNIIQKIDCSTDSIAGEYTLALGSDQGYNFNVVHLSPDGSKLVASQLQGQGRIVIINTADMSVNANLPYLQNPHGIAANPTFDTFYITAQYGNTVYKAAKGTSAVKISIDGKPAATIGDSTGGTPNPHEILMAPDYSKYFVTCENTKEVRVLSRANDSVIKVIPVGNVPKEMAVSKTQPYLFVTCMEDISQVSALFRGSVYVIDYNTLNIVKRIDGEFYQPHGITVDDRNGTFYVASRNANTNGPAPHHTSSCGGRNGYYQVYNLNTLAPVPKRRYEVTPDPYSISVRFKN